MYLPELVPLPWRVLMARERLSLGLSRRSAARDSFEIRRDAVRARLIAFGDVALIRSRASGVVGRFDALQSFLDTADIRVANLEAVVTGRSRPATKIGSGMRAEPEALERLTSAGFDVVNSANNHALDYGSEGLAECIELLAARGIDVCGVERERGQPLVTRVANSVRVGFLGFCDDLNAATVVGLPRPCLWSPEAAFESIAAARRRVDVLIVQMHWGYEFSLHPLRRHRDQARRAVDAGAHAVICHHAHVPQGLEIWKGRPIVHGLGNGFLPISDYLRGGHPWVDRSLAVEFSLASDGIAAVRLHPLGLRRDGSPAPLIGGERKSLLAGVSRMSARLGDDRFLDRCERARLTYEAVRLAASLREAAAGGGEKLGERAALLDLPRQQALMDFLTSHPHTSSLADALRAVAAARQGGRLAAVLAEHAPALSNALEGVRGLYRWRDALRARLP